MAAFFFTESWVAPAPIDEVAAVVTDLERYPQWWPEVRAVAKIGPDTARVLLRAALPYTLDIVLDAVSREPPVLEVAVSGAMTGWVRWGLTAVPGGTRCDYTQEVEVHGALALASYVARPALTWNHRRSMRGCESGLRRRLAERAGSRT